MKYQERLIKLLDDLVERGSVNSVALMLFIAGSVLLFAGVAIDSYNKNSIYFKRPGRVGGKENKSMVGYILDKTTSFCLFRLLKEKIKAHFAIGFIEEEKIKFLSSLAVLILFLLSAFNIILLRNVGQLWYVKLLLAAISIFLPYYVLTLVFDLYRHHISRNIPQLIDEFRSAFIKHRKIKPALKECCRYIDKGLAGAIMKTADAPYMEEKLMQLRDSFNNIWFNIFVSIIINFKNNGGELVDQLYKLNKTMTRYNNLEKKKNKRLIWYELFAVGASVFSIPAIFWINTAILGSDAGVLVDTSTNIMISRIVGFSILSLIVIRILRKM